MKWFLVVFLSIIIVNIVGCSDEKKFDQRFMDAYTEILLARESIADSLEANREVENILSRYDYSEPEFRKAFAEKMQKPEHFMRTLDSVRKLVQNELDSLELIDMKKQVEERQSGQQAN